MTAVDVTIRIVAKAQLGSDISNIDTAIDLFSDDGFEDKVKKYLLDCNDDYRKDDVIIEVINANLVGTTEKKNNKENDDEIIYNQ